MSKVLYYLLGLLAVIVAVIAQYCAVEVLLHPAGRIDPMLRLMAFQLLAGLAEAHLCWVCMPNAYRQPRRVSMVLLWVFCTFVPLFGGIVVLISCLWAAWFPGKEPSSELTHVPRPEFVTYLISRVSHGGGARLQARVANVHVPATDRLSALVAIQRMPTRTTGGLLRELLADPLEDVRLLAYGTLDHAENEIMQKIFQTSKKLEATANEAEQHSLNRLLAELYFELTYQNLVQGEVHRYTLQQADRYAEAALESDNGDAALWVTRGRLALASGKPDEARQYLARALGFGFSRERLAPWLAEADFLHGAYDEVAPLLDELRNAASSPILNPVVKYWSS